MLSFSENKVCSSMFVGVCSEYERNCLLIFGGATLVTASRLWIYWWWNVPIWFVRDVCFVILLLWVTILSSKGNSADSTMSANIYSIENQFLWEPNRNGLLGFNFFFSPRGPIFLPIFGHRKNVIFSIENVSFFNFANFIRQ